MIKFTCPCGKHNAAPDSAAGKRGRCPRCGGAVVIPGASVIAMQPVLSPSAPETFRRPVARMRAPSAGIRLSPRIAWGIAAVVLAAIALTGTIAWKKTHPGPEATYQMFKEAAKKNDADTMWSLMCDSDTKEFSEQFRGTWQGFKDLKDEKLADVAGLLKVEKDKLKSMDLQEFGKANFRMSMGWVAKLQAAMVKSGAKVKAEAIDSIESIAYDGDHAVLSLINTDGIRSRVAMVKEHWSWKIDMKKSKNLVLEDMKSAAK